MKDKTLENNSTFSFKSLQR